MRTATAWPWIPPTLTVAMALGLVACGGGGGSGGGVTSQGGTISGTISVVDGTMADTDTNDPLSQNLDNDDTGNAQQLQNPALVGGFVAATPTNDTNDDNGLPADRFAASTDTSDFYTANLDARQTVRLSNARPNEAALTLILDDGNTPRQDTTTASADTVSVQPASSGTITIEVRADSGYAPYQLSISSPGYTCSTGATAEFVPGQVLVQLRDGASRAGGTAGTLTANALGMKRADTLSPRTQLWDMGNAGMALARLHQLGLTAPPTRLYGENSAVTAREATLAAIEALNQHPDVESATPNYIYRPFVEPGDSLYGSQWNLPLINLPTAWETSMGIRSSTPVVVAVLDTGIFAAHEDLQPKLSGDGYDFVDGDSNPADDGDGTLFHGSHVAGIAAAATTDAGGSGPGIAGVGWDTEIMPVRVLDGGGAPLSQVIQGARYAAGLLDGNTPARPAQIINMSLGGKGGCLGDAGAEAFDAIRRGPDGDRGTRDDVILIAAAGNAGDTDPQFPASYSSVISVSATNRNDQLAWYSSSGQFVDVAAPGGDMSSIESNGIRSTVATNSGGTLTSGYAYFQGTSMAAPHVAGMAALMEAVYPDLNADRFETALKQGQLTTDISGSGTDRTDAFGYGRIDAEAAVLWANGGGSLNTMVAAHPEVMTYETETGSSAVTRTLTVRESAGGDLGNLGTITVTADDDPDNWLTVSDTATAGEYEVTIDPTQVPDRTYSSTVTVETDTGGTTVPVLLRKGIVDVTEDASLHYIFLINVNTNDVVQQIARGTSGGTYDFEFTSVPNGTYGVFASTDIDNDGVTCIAQPWEACGGTSRTFSVSGGTVSGADFTTGFGTVSTGVLRSDVTTRTRTDH